MLSILSLNNIEITSKYLQIITNIAPLQNPSVSIPHYFFYQLNEYEILLLSSKYALKTLVKVNQLILHTTNLNTKVSELIKLGCVFIHQKSDRKNNNIVIIKGNEGITYVLIEKNNFSTSNNSNTLQEMSEPTLFNILNLFVQNSSETPTPPTSPTSPKSSTISSSLTSSTANSSSTTMIVSTLKWNPPKGTIIPTLFPKLLHNNSFQNIYPNSSEPIPFKTELFEGIVLLLIRTIPMEQRYKHIFLKGSTCFEIQVQGKFLKQPQGKLFIGAEITKAMNLGMITRGICSSILQFVRSINPFIHHSFGDSENIELPHITGPLWCMSDRIVITPPGQIPPPLGQTLPEDETRRSLRRSNPSYEEIISLDSVYSFSTNTENIELCDWAMVNVPLMKKFDLHTFWSDADIRLCAYCVPHNSQSSTNKSEQSKFHYQSTNEYMLCLELQHLTNHPDRQPNNESYYQSTNEEGFKYA